MMEIAQIRIQILAPDDNVGFLRYESQVSMLGIVRSNIRVPVMTRLALQCL